MATDPGIEEGHPDTRTPERRTMDADQIHAMRSMRGIDGWEAVLDAQEHHTANPPDPDSPDQRSARARKQFLAQHFPTWA